MPLTTVAVLKYFLTRSPIFFRRPSRFHATLYEKKWQASAMAFTPAPLKAAPVAKTWVKAVRAPVMRAEPSFDAKAAAIPAAAFLAASPAFAESTDVSNALRHLPPELRSRLSDFFLPLSDYRS